jgi:hypothetical protein
MSYLITPSVKREIREDIEWRINSLGRRLDDATAEGIIQKVYAKAERDGWDESAVEAMTAAYKDVCEEIREDYQARNKPFTW